jgi:acetyl esterase/lipase
MKSSSIIVGIILALFSVASFGAVELPKEEPLWPGGVPDNALAHKEQEKNTLMIGKTGKAGGGSSNVSVPTMMVFPAPKDNATRAAVVVYPGGGYRNVVLGKEGVTIAKRLNEMGITAVVVKYRTMPTEPNGRINWAKNGKLLPFVISDGERAVRTVRSRAAKLGIDPNKVGTMGFSAGAHLAASVMLGADDGVKDSKDPVERISSRPDFTCMIYGGFDKEMFDKAQAKTTIGPCFIAIAANDDKAKPEELLQCFEMLRKINVPVELHVFQTGGHGFGEGRPDNTTNTWMDTFGVWLKQNGFCR